MAEIPKTIIQLAGQPCAGKTEIAGYLRDVHDFETFNPGEKIRQFAEETGMQLQDRGDYKVAHTMMMRERGRDVIPDEVLPMAVERVCVDGMRVPVFARRIRHAAGGISRIIAAHCPVDVRFERFREMTGHRQLPDFELFLRDEEREYRSRVPYQAATLTVMEEADLHIDTNRPMADIQENLDGMIVPLLR